MDRSEVKKIVEREADSLLRRMGLEGWSISYGFTPESASDGRLKHGECSRLIDYASAFVSLNPESFECEADVLSTLRHEFFHVVLSPFDLYASSVEGIDSLDDSARQVLSRVWCHSVEKAVRNLEKLWDRLPQPESPKVAAPKRAKRATKSAK